MSIQTFFVDNQRMIIVAVSFIITFVSGLYIGRYSDHFEFFQLEEYHNLIFTAKTNQTLAPIPDEMSLHNLGTKYQTDKVTYHHYDPMYEKYVRKYVGTNITILEIGLGCGMSYGPGASAYLWRNYLGPLANIHFLEFDRGCGEVWYKDHGQKLNIKMHYGSQDDVVFLNTVRSENGYFDVIIDDGGHSMNQQITSFLHLFSKVRSGGEYVIEDLHTSYMGMAGAGYLVKTSTIELIKRLIDDIQVDWTHKSVEISEKIFSFELSNKICIFVKK